MTAPLSTTIAAMSDSALYFPYIEIPQRQSLWSVLLYWDTLGSIIPEGIDSDLGEWTRRLIDAELVTPIDPQRYIGYRSYRNRFADGFAELLDRLPDQWPPAPPVFIHVRKGDRIAWELLAERGLAQQARRTARHGFGQDWIAVEGRTGALYMAYLATYLAQIPDLDMEPITDQSRYFEAIGGPATFTTARTFDAMRASVLRDVLPAPLGDVDPWQLAKFKEAHRPLLLLFRRAVEQAVLRCAREPDQKLRLRLAREEVRELRDQADEVRRKLEERRWPTAEGSMCAVLGGLPGVIGGLATGKPGLAVAAGTTPLLIDFVRSRFSDPVKDAPAAAYAVLAREAFP